VTATPRDRTGFFDLVAQLRSKWAIVVAGGLLGLVVGVIVSPVGGGVAGQDAARYVSLLILLVAALAGLVVGFVVGLVLTYLQPRVTTADDVRRVTGLPVLAQLPAYIVDADDFDERATSRRMRTSLREAVMNTRSLAGGVLPKRLVVARTDSAAESSGVDGGLARALVESGFVPALVQTDFESRLLVRPSTVDFGTTSIGDEGEIERPDAAGYQRVPVPDRVASARPADRTEEVDDLLDLLGDRYDVTVAQAASNSFPVPLRGIAPVADAVLLVVRSNRTTVEGLLSLYGELLSLGVAPLGVVMTGVAARHRVLLRQTWVPSDFRESAAAGASRSGAAVAVPAGLQVAVPAGVPVSAAAVVVPGDPAPARSGFSIADLATLASNTSAGAVPADARKDKS
jgi:hypothetical protein